MELVKRRKKRAEEKGREKKAVGEEVADDAEAEEIASMGGPLAV